MPAFATAPVTTSLMSCASVLPVWRSIGEMLQPMIAMSSGLSPGFAISGHPVHESGIVDVGLTGRDPPDESAFRPGVEVGAFAFRRPYRGHASADADILDRHVDQRLEAEDDVDAVELDVRTRELLGLGLAGILDGLDDRVVRDDAGLRQVDLVLRGELDVVDRAEALGARVHAAALGALEAEEPALLVRLVAAGDVR